MKADFSTAATGLLGAFHRLGVLSWGDVHVAAKIAHLYQEADERVALALGLTVRALRAGSVCLDFSEITQLPAIADEDADPIPAELWPNEKEWISAITASPMVASGTGPSGGRPLRWVAGLLYLERYFHEESNVGAELAARRKFVDRETAFQKQWLDDLFAGVQADPQQQLAIAVAALCGVSVIAGGPGTGKTATIARLLTFLLSAKPDSRIALAAPTGKAAARMEEAVNQAASQLPAPFSKAADSLRESHASTIHRLLGWTPVSRNRFVHHFANPLPHDIVVVDEASMVNVVLMSRLLSALRPEARLVLVGDPDQLAPVEAGAVLADIVEHPSPPPGELTQRLAELGLPDSSYVVRLKTNHRFSGVLADLAAAVLQADADKAVALAKDNGLLFGEVAGSGLRERVTETGLAMIAAAREGDADQALAAMDAHRLLCGHRQGRHGVTWWTGAVEEWLAEADPSFDPQQHWYPGQPLLVTKNMPDIGLSNGDTGIVVANAEGTAELAYFSRGGHSHAVSVFLLEEVQPAHAMTVHKAQGSQFETVSLILPPLDSPLLNRELLYTAITRAKSGVRLIGSEEALRRAVVNRARRASGLAKRL